MRKLFSELLFNQMSQDDKIYLVTADLGYKMWDSHFSTFPDRCINVGASEQLMIGVCIGLAESGKIPIAYSITPFLIYRPFEIIRNYVDKELIPIKLVGSGIGKDYNIDGFSHWCEEIYEVMNIFKNIMSLYPHDKNELKNMFDEFLYNQKPTFIGLRR